MEMNDLLSSFSFSGYLIDEAEIQIKEVSINGPLSVSFDPVVKKGLNDHEYIFILKVCIKDDSNTFCLKVSMQGFFSYQGNSSELIEYMSLNAPAIMFPYIRAYVSNITALSGISPMVMPTMNLTGVGNDIKEKMKQLLEE